VVNRINSFFIGACGGAISGSALVATTHLMHNPIAGFIAGLSVAAVGGLSVRPALRFLFKDNKIQPLSDMAGFITAWSIFLSVLTASSAHAYPSAPEIKSSPSVTESIPGLLTKPIAPNFIKQPV
jgi:hypothetical protein